MQSRRTDTCNLSYTTATSAGQPTDFSLKVKCNYKASITLRTGCLNIAFLWCYNLGYIAFEFNKLNKVKIGYGRD